MRLIGALVLALALLPAVAGAAPPASCPAPPDLHDGWTVAAPAQKELDPALICAIGPRLEKMPEAHPEAVVVVRHGALVYEHYFSGGDEQARIQRDASTLHDVHSVTKSVTAILTGIAFGRGWLKSLDVSIFTYLPQYADLRTPDKDKITLRDLLTMTSGLAWPELPVPARDVTNIHQRMWNASDPYRFLLSQPLAATPGTVWNYDSGAVDLLGLILQKVCGQPLDLFAKNALMAPLGITDWRWGNPSGGLDIRPRDLTKIGQLVLNGGTWHGRQIVSAAWIKAMTMQQISGWTISLRGKSYSYGYLWWLGREKIDNRDIDWVAGVGYAGQRLFVVPSEDLVVLATAYVHAPNARQGLAGDTALDMALRAAIGH